MSSAPVAVDWYSQRSDWRSAVIRQKPARATPSACAEVLSRWCSAASISRGGERPSSNKASRKCFQRADALAGVMYSRGVASSFTAPPRKRSTFHDKPSIFAWKRGSAGIRNDAAGLAHERTSAGQGKGVAVRVGLCWCLYIKKKTKKKKK